MVRGRPRSLVELNVLMAPRMAWWRQFGGSIVRLQGGDVSVRLMSVTVVRQRVRQHGGRAGGPDDKSQGGSKETPIAQAALGAKLNARVARGQRADDAETSANG